MKYNVTGHCRDLRNECGIGVDEAEKFLLKHVAKPTFDNPPRDLLNAMLSRAGERLTVPDRCVEERL